MFERRRFGAFLKKEYLQLWRDRRLWILGLVAPVVMLVIFVYALPRASGRIPTVIVVEDEGGLWRDYYNSLNYSPQFDLKGMVSRSEAAQKLVSGEIKVVLRVPRDYTRLLNEGRTATVDVIIDGSDPTVAGPALVAADAVVSARSQGFILSLANEVGILEGSEWHELGQPVKPNIEVLFNRSLRYVNFTLPGVIGLILQQMTLALTALAFVGEREHGTLEQLMATPLRRLEIVIGKVLPFGTLTIISVLAIVAVGKFWFKVPLRGDPLLLIGLSGIFVAASMAMGFCVSLYSRTQAQALVMTQLILVPTFVLSGFIFSREVMPPVVRAMGEMIPLTHYLTIARGIFLRGSDLSLLWQEALILVGFAVVLFSTAGLMVRRQAN